MSDVKLLLADQPIQRIGMANVYIRGETLWVCGYMDGVKERFSLKKKDTKTNRAWAEKNKDKFFYELLSQKRPPKEKITLEEYGTYFLDITSKNRNAFTQKENLRHFKKVFEYFESMCISQIKTSDIQKWQNELNYAPKTIRNYRGTLNIILEMAYQDKIINPNPLKSVKVPKNSKTVPFSYSIDDVKKLLLYAEGQMKNILQFAFFSEVRPSELIALKWSDINFTADTVKIERRIRDGNVDLPKGYKVRIIDLLPQAKEALKRQQRLTGLGEWVWISQDKVQYKTPKVINENFKLICEKANIKKVGFYDATKNSFCTLMLEYGQSESWLIQQVGHENINITRTHYIGKIKPDLEKLKSIAV